MENLALLEFFKTERPDFLWQSPMAFSLLIVLLALSVFLLFFKGKKGAFFYSDLSLFLKSGSSLRARMTFIPSVLKILSLICMVYALARPQTTVENSYQTQEGLDIMIVMDISLSMLVEDMGANITRLSASKDVVKNFIEGRPQDRMGLIVFSGESFTKTPLTYDHDLLKKNLSEVKTLSYIKSGTAIGVALANSAVRLKSSPEKSRVIIFLTDGENNTGFIDPATALELIKKHKIKVYTVGLGRKNGPAFIKYPERDQSGAIFYRRIKIFSQINTELMSKISKETGGQFFMATSLKSLQSIFNQINQLETYDIKINSQFFYEEHFQSYLKTALFLYILSVLLSLTVFFKGI